MTIRKLVGTLENKGPYIDQSTGHWFYWNGTGSTGTAPNTLIVVTLMQLNPLLNLKSKMEFYIIQSLGRHNEIHQIL